MLAACEPLEALVQDGEAGIECHQVFCPFHQRISLWQRDFRSIETSAARLRAAGRMPAVPVIYRVDVFWKLHLAANGHRSSGTATRPARLPSMALDSGIPAGMTEGALASALGMPYTDSLEPANAIQPSEDEDLFGAGTATFQSRHRLEEALPVFRRLVA